MTDDWCLIPVTQQMKFESLPENLKIDIWNTLQIPKISCITNRAFSCAFIYIYSLAQEILKIALAATTTSSTLLIITCVINASTCRRSQVFDLSNACHSLAQFTKQNNVSCQVMCKLKPRARLKNWGKRKFFCRVLHHTIIIFYVSP